MTETWTRPLSLVHNPPEYRGGEKINARACDCPAPPPPPSKIAVKLQSVPIGVADMKLACAPRRIPHVSDVCQNTLLAKFRAQSIDVVHDEPVRRTVVGKFPFLRVVPLKVQLDAVAAHAGIPCPARVVSKCNLETKHRVEADGRLD